MNTRLQLLAVPLSALVFSLWFFTTVRLNER